MKSTLISRLPLAAKLGLPLAATALVAAACSSGGSGSSGAGSSGSTGADTASGGATVISVHTGSSGSFLTDGKGRALYLFASDTASKSTCSGQCLSAWPALTSEGTAHAGSGVTASDITTLAGRQVEYDGHPLYYYAGDQAAGQTNGQGLDQFGAKWWLVTPAGAELTGSTSGGNASSSSGGSGGGGYGY